MDSYIDLLKLQKGGETGTFIGGGFPPIYECIPEPKSEEKSKKREFGKESVISVYNILDNRRKTPFISLPQPK